jgi:septal ring factor EnvC (AmiA/AmiB activator)
MENLLKTAKEIKELVSGHENLKHKYDNLLAEKLSVECLCFSKDKKCKEQEESINSLKSNIKGLQKSIVRLNKTPEIQEIKGMENKFKGQIFDLEGHQKELLIKINRLQSKNNSLSVKNIKKQKIITELTELIKNV